MLRRVASLRAWSFIFLLLVRADGTNITAQAAVFDIVARTGQDNITAIENSASINDAGHVAYVASDLVGSRIWFHDGAEPDPTFVTTIANPPFTYGREIQLNNNYRIVAVRSRGGTSSANIWHATTTDSLTQIAESSTSFPRPDTHFEGIGNYASLSNDGLLTFAGLEAGMWEVHLSNSFVDRRDSENSNSEVASFTSTTIFRPMAANGQRVVIGQRVGAARRVTLYDLSGGVSLPTTIADTAGGAWTDLGLRPGISDDGQIVVFYGDRGVSSIDPGPGIFASIQTTAGQVIERIAAPTDGFTSFNSAQRIGVNSTQDLQRAVTVTYIATRDGKEGIYTSRLNFFGTGVGCFDPANPGSFAVSNPRRLVEQGDSILGLGGTVQSVGLNDPINSRDRADIVFHATTSTGDNGLIRARPEEVVYLDFDPQANFTPSAFASGLFSSLGVPASFVGNLADVFSSFAPGRADLNGSVATIQNNIVDKVQASFDAAKVNAKVLGRSGETAPTDGPFMRVFIGDGPHANSNPNGTAGITFIDLFNQDSQYLGGTFAAVQETPLILVDNIFRTSNGFFTDANGTASVAIPLSDTGPHMITAAQVENAIASTTAHEIGHSLGLEHLENNLNHLIMNANVSSPLTDGFSTDELRTVQSFSMSPEQLSTTDGYSIGDHQNDSSRLAFAVGSDEDPATLSRDAPSAAVLANYGRDSFRTSASITGDYSVSRAVLGIVPHGSNHLVPELIDLGSGDLASLLDVEIDVRPNDQLFLVASSDGSGIDIFSVFDGFTGDVTTIDLSNALLLMTEPTIRGDAANGSGIPLPNALDLYQIMDGTPILLGSFGTVAVSEPSLLGDYNSNGVVDAADYVVWRKGDSPDDSQAGYDLWRAHFGETAPGVGSSQAVPEPVIAVFLYQAICAGGIVAGRFRKKRR